VTVQWSPAGTDVSVWAETGCDHEDGVRSAKRQRRLAVNVSGGAIVGRVSRKVALDYTPRP